MPCLRRRTVDDRNENSKTWKPSPKSNCPLPGLVAIKISKDKRLGTSPRKGFLFYCSIIPGSRKEKVINGK